MNGHERDQPSGDGHKTRKPQLVAISLLVPLALLTLSALLASQSALGSTNLLSNEGFEDGTTDWVNSPHTTFITVTEPVTQGAWAASLNESGAVEEIYIFQDVDVEAGATYTLTGWVYMNDDKFNEACLRIRWRGSVWIDRVQTCLEGKYGSYRPITVGSIIAPTDAMTARIMALASIRDAPDEPVYFDDLTFTSNIEPTPTPTPMGTPYYVPLVVKSYGS